MRSSHANGETHRRPECSPQGSTPTITKRNEATSGQHALTSQWTGENLRAVKKKRTGENPRAVEIQWIGVNPRAEIACSHLQDSTRTRRRTNNAQTGADQARSMPRNVFKRLGKGADMIDTLNKR